VAQLFSLIQLDNETFSYLKMMLTIGWPFNDEDFQCNIFSRGSSCAEGGFCLLAGIL